MQAKSLTAQIIPSFTAFMSDVAASRRTWSRPLTRLLRTAKVKRPFFGCELERYLTSTEIWVRIATEPPLFNNFIKGYPEPNLRTCMERGRKALRETQPVKKIRKPKQSNQLNHLKFCDRLVRTHICPIMIYACPNILPIIDRMARR